MDRKSGIMADEAVDESFVSKTVYWIRHAESEYNASQKKPSRIFSCRCCCDPGIIDAPITPKGQRQVQRLHESLHRLKLFDAVELVISSPLTRALQTAIGGFKGSQAAVMVHADIREIVDTYCDIGSPVSELRLQEAFSNVDFSELEKIEDREEEEEERYVELKGAIPHSDAWWFYSIEHGPRIPIGEPKAVVDARAKHFLSFLASRPERVIALVSHSSFIRKLIGGSKLSNCGMAETILEVTPSGGVSLTVNGLF